MTTHEIRTRDGLGWPTRLGWSAGFAAGAACAGVAAVLLTGMLTARLFEWYLWLAIGPVTAGAASVLGRRVSTRLAGQWWPSLVSALAGGLFGAFMAAASIETHQGLAWLEYGAIFGFGSCTFVACVTAAATHAAAVALHPLLRS